MKSPASLWLAGALLLCSGMLPAAAAATLLLLLSGLLCLPAFRQGGRAQQIAATLLLLLVIVGLSRTLPLAGQQLAAYRAAAQQHTAQRSGLVSSPTRPTLETGDKHTQPKPE